jgi:nicotinamide-nucleotide amidase
MNTPISDPRGKHFELLILGNEFLLGIVPNRGIAFVGDRLGQHGVTLNRATVLLDNLDDAAGQIRQSLERSDVVMTVAGLGPNCDDITREAVSIATGKPLVCCEKIAAQISRKLPKNKILDECWKRQAFRVEGAEWLPNPHGPAPAQWLRLDDGKLVIMLPGTAHELGPVFLNHVLPRLDREGLLNGKKHFVQIRTTGLDESALESALRPVLARQPLKLLLSYASHDGITDCLIASADGAATRNQLHKIAAECAAVLGDNFVCVGNASLAAIVTKLLRDRNERFSSIETSTGGMLANAFASIPGITKFFAGGIACPEPALLAERHDITGEILQQHCLVSS